MKNVKLISIITAGIFCLSLFAPVVSATVANEENIDSDIVSATVSDDVEGSLIQLRKDKEEFKNSKQLEEREKADSLREKIAANRKAAEARAEAAKKVKDEKRKAVLVRLIDIQIKQLKNTKERIAKMPSIKEDLKAGLSDKINEVISELESEKTVLNAITAPEDLKKFAKELKDSFKQKRDIVKAIVDAILASKTNSAVESAEARLAELSSKIADLKTAGQDTAELEKILAVVESKIASADTKAGKEDFKGAIKDLRDAYNSMKKALEKSEDEPESSPVPSSSVEPTAAPTPAE